jgi:uncharacterized membrane protein
MRVRCACNNCRGSIVFDVADFAEQNRTSTQIIGQNVRCPHCGYATAITMSLERWSKASSTEGISAGPTVIILLTLLIALVPAIIIAGLIQSGVTIKQIATGGAGASGYVAAGIVGTGALIAAVMWLIFPWLAWSLLSKIHNDLTKIERNTRASRGEIARGRSEAPM